MPLDSTTHDDACDDTVKQLCETLGQPLDEAQRARLRAIGDAELFAALELFWDDLDAGSDRAFEILADVRGIPRSPEWSKSARRSSVQARTLAR